jgi:hypothetical protein
LQKQCIFKQSNRYAKEKERNRKLKLEREDLQITNHKKNKCRRIKTTSLEQDIMCRELLNPKNINYNSKSPKNYVKSEIPCKALNISTLYACSSRYRLVVQLA